MPRPLSPTRMKQLTTAVRQLCDVLDHRYPSWLEHTAHELSLCDGFPARGEQVGGRTTAELTGPERHAEIRLHLESARDYITGTLEAAPANLRDALEAMDHALGLRAPAPPEAYCSTGSGREGADLPWTPHSRDPRNGWADPTCRELAAAGRAGLCAACSQREDAWRRRSGLPPRSHVIPTGEVA